MSWEASSFAMVALVVVAGFAWYERTRPPSQTVALVASLAALAVAGRLVLTPLPNVVATTDVVLFTGYAIGGAPGFAVGALSAVVSNFWLGQGPWTPWQMAGWGMVGVGGAALAATFGRELGRVSLALACGVAGLAYGALLDLSVMVTYGGEQSFDRYLALSARGIPFNVAHALGNVVLALAAGPALVRMLVRYRERFEVRWRPAHATIASVLVLLAVPIALAIPLEETRASSGVGGARLWLEGAQNHDGGYGAAPGDSSSGAMTGWAMLGLEAADRNPLEVVRDGRSAVDFLRSRASSISSTGDLERTILALVAAGVNPRDFAGRDLVGALQGRREGSGSFEGQVNLTAFGILALRAADAGAGLDRSARWLRQARNKDGGWGFQSGVGSDPDSTGAALQGLVAAGGGGRAIKAGVSYLKRAQAEDGGFRLAEYGPTNTQSTAWAVQGLLAAGAEPSRVRNEGKSPLDYLRAQQASDGHFRYSSSSDQTPVWVTAQGLMAIAREPFPVSPVPKSGEPGGLDLTPSLQRRIESGTAGGGGGRGTIRRGGGGRAPGDGGPGSPGAVSGETGAGTGAVAADEVAVGEEAAAEGDGRSIVENPRLVFGGLGVMAAGLAGGWLWYRRRLPF